MEYQSVTQTHAQLAHSMCQEPQLPLRKMKELQMYDRMSSQITQSDSTN